MMQTLLPKKKKAFDGAVVYGDAMPITQPHNSEVSSICITKRRMAM
jgi:hypothetical protein